jgi:hypothetical protein
MNVVITRTGFAEDWPNAKKKRPAEAGRSLPTLQVEHARQA